MSTLNIITYIFLFIIGIDSSYKPLRDKTKSYVIGLTFLGLSIFQLVFTNAINTELGLLLIFTPLTFLFDFVSEKKLTIFISTLTLLSFYLLQTLKTSEFYFLLITFEIAFIIGMIKTKVFQEKNLTVITETTFRLLTLTLLLLTSISNLILIEHLLLLLCLRNYLKINFNTQRTLSTTDSTIPFSYFYNLMIPLTVLYKLGLSFELLNYQYLEDLKYVYLVGYSCFIIYFLKRKLFDKKLSELSHLNLVLYYSHSILLFLLEKQIDFILLSSLMFLGFLITQIKLITNNKYFLKAYKNFLMLSPINPILTLLLVTYFTGDNLILTKILFITALIVSYYSFLYDENVVESKTKILKHNTINISFLIFIIFLVVIYLYEKIPN